MSIAIMLFVNKSAFAYDFSQTGVAFGGDAGGDREERTEGVRHEFPPGRGDVLLEGALRIGRRRGTVGWDV